MRDHHSDEAGRSAHRAADRLLVRASRRGGWALGALSLVSLGMAFAETALPAVLGRAVDAVVGGSGTGAWTVWCAGLIVALVAFDLLDDLLVGATTARSTAWLRLTFLRHVLDLGPKAVRLPSGDVASRMGANAGAAGKVAPEMVRAAANVVPSVGGIVALALIDPWLCVTFLAGLPLVVVLLRSFVRDASSMASGYLATQAGIASRLVDALAGIRTVAAAAAVDREVDRVLRPLPDLHRYGMGMWRAQMRLSTQDALLLPLLELLVLAVGGFRLAGGHLSPGELLAAGQYVQLASNIGSAAGILDRLARARAGAARVADVLDDEAVAYGDAVLPPGEGKLELRDVTVRAGGRAVFDRVSLVVPGGALVAVVGSSGSGKSVLAALAGRLVHPDEGSVLLDGADLRSLPRDELRRAVSYGFARPALLGDTVADAIAFGVYAPSFEDVVAAGCGAQADPFIRHLPQGYATPVQEAPMSGGEAQRVGLARTFAHAGRLIVLDDVAASLDTVTEHQIARVLTARLAGRTRLVVAHRASTAARADLVVWLDGGRVRALRPHQLLWDDPAYRAVFEATEGAGEEPVTGSPADETAVTGRPEDGQGRPAGEPVVAPSVAPEPVPPAEPVEVAQGAA